ncbi:MAG: hypothetical protein CG440_881 [Methanosaeta sp. NSM2]|nr:MAG: hypothetical protein CG440_881 [Methanosaeta sp. NSM2]
MITPEVLIRQLMLSETIIYVDERTRIEAKVKRKNPSYPIDFCLSLSLIFISAKGY